MERLLCVGDRRAGPEKRIDPRDLQHVTHAMHSPASANLRPDLLPVTSARTSPPTAMESTEGTAVRSRITRGAFVFATASWNAPDVEDVSASFTART
jgi:hypothetical protein